ncbi:MAG: hypothetical protein ACOYXM_16875 [Actinomycetota bacterium]
MHTLIRTAGFGALLSLLTLGGAACSDDDNGDTGSGATTTAGDGDAELVAFCDAFVEVTAAFEGDEPPSADEGEAILTEVEDNTPDEVAEPVEAVVASAREVLGGNPDAFDDAFFSSLGAIDAFRYENCPSDAQVEVTAVEYAFEDVPDTIPAGTVAFKMSNEGEEEHEVILFARAEGEARSFEEIVALPEEEAESAVRFVGAAFAAPGSDAIVIADLEPGDYAMACFVPVGGGEDGPPHVSEGMLAEFSVS